MRVSCTVGPITYWWAVQMTYKCFIQNAEITKSSGAVDTLSQETHDNMTQNALGYIF